MRIVICDDQKYMCEETEKYCKEYFEKIGRTCEISCISSGEEFLESGWIPDILFLDVEMDGISGLEVAQTILDKGNRQTFVIYQSSYEKYMEAAMDLNVIGYLHKPVNAIKIKRALDKVLQRKQQFACIEVQPDKHVAVGNIVQIYAEDVYSIVVESDGMKNLTRKSINDWEKEMEPYDFVRVSRSNLVNLRFVKNANWVKGVCELEGETLQISRRRKKIVQQKYEEYKKK